MYDLSQREEGAVRTQIIAAAAAVVLLVAGVALGGRADGSVVLQLRTQHHSKLSGTATLTPHGQRFTVDIVLHGPKSKLARSYPAHIHNVTCTKYATLKTVGAQYITVNDTLTDVAHGRSHTVVDTPLTARGTGKYAINVHLPTGSFPTVACGNIPAFG